MAFKIELTGNNEIDKVLQSLPVELGEKVQTSAYVAAARIVQDAAILAAPFDTGDLADSIEIAIERKGKNAGTVYVGPNINKGGWVARFIEFGTSAYTIELQKKRGKKVLANKQAGEVFGQKVQNPGLPPRPFMRPAWEQNRDKVIASIKDTLARRVLSLMKRTIKKSK